MTNADIEKAARELQVEMWRRRDELWPDGPPPLIAMWEPEVAARMLGITYEIHEEIGGSFPYRGVRHETAGLIDRQANKIAISRRFAHKSLRFTGAHELGHWVLNHGDVMWRDRPANVNTLIGNVPKEEREANYFAACFLMPRKLLWQTLENTFGVALPLTIDDDAAFNLCPQEPDAILRADQDSLDFHALIAGAHRYGIRTFDSLAKQFDVSVQAMARRLQELRIIR